MAVRGLGEPVGYAAETTPDKSGGLKRWIKSDGLKMSKKKPQANKLLGVVLFGGNGEIRTLDEALHPILP